MIRPVIARHCCRMERAFASGGERLFMVALEAGGFGRRARAHFLFYSGFLSLFVTSSFLPIERSFPNIQHSAVAVASGCSFALSGIG